MKNKFLKIFWGILGILGIFIISLFIFFGQIFYIIFFGGNIEIVNNLEKNFSGNIEFFQNYKSIHSENFEIGEKSSLKIKVPNQFNEGNFILKIGNLEEINIYGDWLYSFNVNEKFEIFEKKGEVFVKRDLGENKKTCFFFFSCTNLNQENYENSKNIKQEKAINNQEKNNLENSEENFLQKIGNLDEDVIGILQYNFEDSKMIFMNFGELYNALKNFKNNKQTRLIISEYPMGGKEYSDETFEKFF